MALTKTKQDLNISIYLSNEEPFIPLLLNMFCKISKMDDGKKIGKLAKEWNDKCPTLLYASLFVGMQEYMLICVFQLVIDF